MSSSSTVGSTTSPASSSCIWFSLLVSSSTNTGSLLFLMLLSRNIFRLSGFDFTELPFARPQRESIDDSLNPKHRSRLMVPLCFALRSSDSWSVFSRCNDYFFCFSSCLALSSWRAQISWSCSPVTIPIPSSPRVVFGVCLHFAEFIFF